MATDYSKLKVVDLKAQLKRRGLPQAGRKDELIARLEEADAAPEEPQSTEEPVSQTAQASEPSPAEEPAVDEPAADDDDRQGEDAEGAIHEHITTDEASTPKASAQVAEPSAPSQAPSQAPSASAEPESTPATLPAASSSELLQDSQKRKRRSASPPPSGHETPRKRARVSGESVAEEPQTSLPAKLGEAEDAKISALNGVGGRQETTAEPDEPLDYGASSPVEQEQDQEAREATPTPASHAAATGARDREPSPEAPRSSTATEVERDVEPAIHPATSALYIKNFMRPLHKPVVEQYLIDLASPAAAAAADPDPDVVVDFFLDTIRTHAFVRFASVAAASRVRTALHGVVWPDERNRKPLWADFVPPDEIAGWVDREQQGAAGSRSLNRWEVVYETDDGGRGGRRVVAVLREAGLDPPSSTNNSGAGARPPTGPAAAAAAASSGKVDIPTGPSSRVYPGIEAAPSGPRGYLDRSSRAPGPPSSSSSGRQAGPGGPEQTTRAHPPISYQPVSAEVAKRRVAHVHSFVPRDPQRRALVGRDKNRYTFEMGDKFVDRGPEMFEGIRPPHRERERRAAGGAAFGGGGRQGGGARGFGRGPGSSRYDDYRPPPRRYEQYRGGGGRDDYRDRRY
ncbi:uncharacterized protein E0L32_005572 [Thyridium curvatum]|uniref:SAP domain-containing protein n=1 Tax=Thyridium curvatum TaxID=1093900 RepID=A0A507B5K5_9PEZI|nr:uncharacterized protein E0L32_005572 [Thyridium curvatum]TPX14376.1 hypothetical protein E0L32_005572 [Thyridium curvatum]